MCYGPYAADSFFGSKNYKNFDAIVATYHDQGLIPFKTLAFGNGVNYTAGLTKFAPLQIMGRLMKSLEKVWLISPHLKKLFFREWLFLENRKMNKTLTSNPLLKLSKKR